MAQLIVLLVVVAVLGVLIVLGLALGRLAISGYRSLRLAWWRRSTLRLASRELDIPARGNGLAGQIDGVDLIAEPVGFADNVVVRCVARLEPPLGLGLRIEPWSVLREYLLRFKAGDETPLSKRYRARARHHDQLERLLDSPIEGELLRLHAFHPEITDHFVELEAGVAGKGLVGLVRETAGLAQVTSEIAASLPESQHELELHEGWKSVAAKLGGEVDEIAGELKATLPSGAVEVSMLHAGHEKCRTEFSIELARPLLIDVAISNEKPGPRWLPRGRSDLKTGVDDFDDRFLVQGDKRVVKRLDEKTRKTLADLAREVDTFLVTESHIDASVAHAVRGADELGHIVSAIERAAEAISKPRRRGPYR